MKEARALWAGVAMAALAMPGIAAGAGGRIHFVGSIVVPASCQAQVSLRQAGPRADAACHHPAAPAAAPQAPHVSIQPLPRVTAAPPGRPQAYVVTLSYR